VILLVDGEERPGPAIDARALAVDADALVESIRTTSDDTVSCPPPSHAHTHIGFVHPETTLSRRSAQAAVARTRGFTTEFDHEIRRTRRELATMELPTADVSAAMEAVAAASADVDSRRDEVARLGGIVAATDGPNAEADSSADTVGDAQAKLRTEAAALAEAETALQTAREELALERDRQRAANDARERRLRLQDRLENLRRDARRTLAVDEAARTERALDAIPDWPEASADARYALALARNAHCRAPVVVTDDPFRTAVQARACLAAPVILV